MKKVRVCFNVAVIILSFFMLLIPKVFPVCGGVIETAQGGSVPMKCHWASNMIVLVALMMIFTSIILLIVKESCCKSVLSIISIMLSVAAIVVVKSKLLGVCMKKGMMCNKTAFAVVILTIIFCLFHIALLYINNKDKNN